jgi:UDP-N-acetylmuramate--alanine ligase
MARICDGSHSKVTDDLQKEGLDIFIGHDAKHIGPDVDLVIYSIAVTQDNPEVVEAKSRGIVCMTYPEALGELTKEYTTIAVCGTHGKTTTTAMIASMLEACGESPTVIVGSLLAEKGTNFIQGKGKYLVVEACEYKRSFLNLHPTHVIVANIDEDHLDYYKDIHDIHDAFQSFVDKVPVGGSVITHSNVTLHTQAKILDADCVEKESIKLSVLGDHNKSNAQLALTLAKELGLDNARAREGLELFRGTWRRMEYRGEYKGAQLYDDYGHHPTEIRATLQALREKYADGKYKLIVVFQPHLYSRTKLLMDDFSKAFTLADKVYILPIYASREVSDGTVSSLDLVEKTDNAVYIETLEEMKKVIDSMYHSGSVVLTIGAGDVYKLHDILK